MLANGITLSYSETKGSYTKLVGLKEVPEFGIEPEKVENTTLEDKVKKYEFGIGDAGELGTSSLITIQAKLLLTVYCVRQQTTRRNSTLNKLIQTVLRSILKAKYLLNWAVAVSMPLSSSHLRLHCSQNWNLQTVLEVN